MAQSGGAALDQYGTQQSTGVPLTAASNGGSGAATPLSGGTSPSRTTSTKKKAKKPSSKKKSSNGGREGASGSGGGGKGNGRVAGENAGGGGAGSSSGRFGGAANGANAAGNGAGGLGGSGSIPPGCQTRYVFLQFGLAGLGLNYEGPMTRKRLEAFLGSDLPRTFSQGSSREVGRALGAALVLGTPLGLKVSKILFDREIDVTAIRVVITRRKNISDEDVELMKGVAEGLKSTGIPVAYAERSDAAESYVEQFRQLGIPTVDDVDSAAGQWRLAKLLMGECRVDAQLHAIPAEKVKLRNAATLTDADENGGSGAVVLLVGLLGSAGLVTAGAARRRRRGARR